MNVRLEYTMPFTAGVYWDGQMLMNRYLVRLYMITNSSEPTVQNIAYERLKYFVYNQMNSTIFVSSEHQDKCRALIAAGLKITTLPAEPVDQLVGIMLYSKLNAVMEDHIMINEVEISSDLGENMVYLHSADESLGPYEGPGWWHEADLIHCDLALFDSDKIVAMHQAGAWRELDLAWPDQNSDGNNNTVVFARFGQDETK
jgi:hypothetical protein